MRMIALPALIYTLAVFAVGFLLGTIRVLLVVPRIGETTAIYLEIPFMIMVSFFAARWVIERYRVPPRRWHRAAMGLLAFALLMAFEAVISVTLFGNSLTGHLASYLAPAAWPGLAGQLLFAAMPLLLLRFG